MAKIDHAKLNAQKNTDPFFPTKSYSTPKKVEWTLSETDSGGLKLQCRGEVRLKEYLASLTSFLKSKKLETLNWPTIYFSTPELRKKKFAQTPSGPTEEQVSKTPIADSVVTDDDLPWII